MAGRQCPNNTSEQNRLTSGQLWLDRLDRERDFVTCVKKYKDITCMQDNQVHLSRY